MVNLMREHVPQTARLHYVITDGGDAPNIVPETAGLLLRTAPGERSSGRTIRSGGACCEAAAMGTDTQVDVEVMHGNYPVLPNHTLARLVNDNLVAMGGISYTQERLLPKPFAAR